MWIIVWNKINLIINHQNPKSLMIENKVENKVKNKGGGEKNKNPQDKEV